jgi:hypothetical protein
MACRMWELGTLCPRHEVNECKEQWENVKEEQISNLTWQCYGMLSVTSHFPPLPGGEGVAYWRAPGCSAMQSVPRDWNHAVQCINQSENKPRAGEHNSSSAEDLQRDFLSSHEREGNKGTLK